ncbi:M15 family metallopeptidase [Lachnospiraceae bacterium JLR.KK008]
MMQTLKENPVSRYMKLIKKKKWARWVPSPFLYIMAVIASIPAYFASNSKKYACMIVVFLFFVMSSSFSFPIFEDMELTEKTMLYEETDRMELAVAEERPDTGPADDSSFAASEILDDADVLDGYEDTELENMEDIDKYTLDEILEENGAAAEESDASGGGQVSLDEVVFDKDDWRLLLINKQHPIPEDYTFELGTIKGSMKCDERIIEDLLAMLQAAKNDGIDLVICSPYRDLNRQQVLFNRKIKAYMGKGMSYMEAYKVSSQAVTVPGASEHQIGLALDIVCDSYYSLNEGFGDTEAGRWLEEHSCEYGFTLRYPKGKEYITSIEYEPWHFRYVGKEAATVMKEKGICLEEFIDSL